MFKFWQVLPHLHPKLSIPGPKLSKEDAFRNRPPRIAKKAKHVERKERQNSKSLILRCLLATRGKIKHL